MIYFVQIGEDGPVKIGWARDVKRRLAQLQTGQPHKLRLLGQIPGGLTAERKVHEKLAAHRMTGEWFQPSTPVLEWACLAAAIDGRSRNEVTDGELRVALARELVAAGLSANRSPRP